MEQPDARIDICERANISAPVAESDEEKFRLIVVFRTPQKEAKTAVMTTPLEKVTKKTRKQTDKTGETQTTGAALITATTTKTEEVLIESDE